MTRSLFLLLLFPVIAQGQTRGAVPRCTDSLSGARWRLTPLSATVTAPTAGDRDRDRYVTALLEEIGQRFSDPGSALRPPEAPSFVPPATERQVERAALELALDRNGRVLEARITATSGRAAVDSALVFAARNADPRRGYGKMPRKLRGDTVRFAILVADRDLPAGAVSIGTLAHSFLDADTPPRIRSMPPARAPRGHRGKEVVMAGTVNTAGRVIPGSVRVVSTTDSILIPIARRSFEAALFRPGTYHGCPAEATIRQVFRFP